MEESERLKLKRQPNLLEAQILHASIHNIVEILMHVLLIIKGNESKWLFVINDRCLSIERTADNVSVRAAGSHHRRQHFLFHLNDCAALPEQYRSTCIIRRNRRQVSRFYHVLLQEYVGNVIRWSKPLTSFAQIMRQSLEECQWISNSSDKIFGLSDCIYSSHMFATCNETHLQHKHHRNGLDCIQQLELILLIVCTRGKCHGGSQSNNTNVIIDRNWNRMNIMWNLAALVLFLFQISGDI